MDVQEQKFRFVVAATRREKSLTALCEEFGISRPTGPGSILPPVYTTPVKRGRG